MPDLILTPAQVLERPQDYLDRRISVRGFLIIPSGHVVSEEPLEVEFESAIVQSDRPNNEMYSRVNEEGYIPPAFLMVKNRGFVDTVIRGHQSGFFFGCEWLFMAPVVVSARLRKRDGDDVVASYELYEPDVVVIEANEDFGKIISFK